ncbi:MAG: hypothetical protein JSR17_00390 [Proteobacteria bacterium]|nr:hypothetical protein [Pseudomonadota bacterium]
MSDVANACLPKNHISYEAQSNIQKMIKPLEKLGISYFCYGENYHDSSGFTLHTNAAYYETWFNHEGTLRGFYLKDGWHAYDNLLPNEVLAMAHTQNLGNFLTYIEHQKDKTVIYEFAMRPDNNHSMEFYSNNIVLLKRFGKYFSDSLALKLIEIAKEQRIMPPQYMTQKREFDKKYSLLDKEALLDPSLSTLSPKEKSYLNGLLHGLSNKEMGDSDSLSPKTVFMYISNIKKEWGCKSKSDLFAQAAKRGAVNYYFPALHEDITEGQLAASFIDDLYFPLSTLSRQEYKCCQLLLQGYTLAEIAKSLDIQIPTAADYIFRIKAKLSCDKKDGIFAALIEMGIMDVNLVVD